MNDDLEPCIGVHVPFGTRPPVEPCRQCDRRFVAWPPGWVAPRPPARHVDGEWRCSERVGPNASLSGGRRPSA